MYPAKYFRFDEFVCKCCGCGKIDTVLVFMLDILRAWQGAPIKVNSGFRCKDHNTAVGGAENSRHMVGLAADITASDLALLKAHVKQLNDALDLRANGWEIIYYKTFVHIATPRSPLYPWAA